MAGPIVRIGRYRDTSGPDLAVVYDNQQLASFTNPHSHGSRLILYKGGTWGGRYSGVPVSRIALYWHASDGGSPNGLRPGGVAAYTEQMSPTTGYTGGGGGEFMQASLATPFVTDADYQYVVGVTNSSGILGVAMYQASQISEPNESFYRKAITGNIPVDGVSSIRTNEGQLTAWFEGEANVAPNIPTGLWPNAANMTLSRQPVLYANFSDENETLNDGRAWDKLTSTYVEVWGNGQLVWSADYPNSVAEQNARQSATTVGVQLNYGVTYTYFIRHRDRLGAMSGAASASFSIKSPNSPPSQPYELTPNGVISGGLNPTLSMRHSDPDGNNSLNIGMQLRRKSTQAIMLDVAWPASVANNGYAQRVYDGSTLAYNTEYEWRGRTMDTAGSWGEWSGWVTFQITSLSSVDTPTSPSGFQATQTPANIVATYRHNAGVNSQAFKVAIYSNTGAYLGETGWINKTVASGSNVTITWAETGFSGIGWGTTIGLSVLAQDANGVVAQAWSGLSWFNVNAAPTVPSGLSPSGGSYSTRPLLIVENVTDADTAQDPRSSLIVKGVLTTSAGTFTRTFTYVAARDRWEYQTTSTDLPTQGATVNQWQAYSFDGTVYSGGTTVEANASKSAVATFIYAAVPAVAITSTTTPIETSTPTLTWTADATQKSYRVRGYMNGVLVYDSGVQVTATLSHTVSAAYFLNGEAWNTGETIAWEVSSTSTLDLTGTSAQVSILLQYTPPPSVTLAGETTALPQTTQQNAMSLWHEPTSVLQANFEGYVWLRDDLDQQGNVVPGTEVRLATVTNAGITSMVDASVVSGKRYRWSVHVLERRGNDVVPSGRSFFTGGTTWDGIVVHAPADPLGTAVELRWSTSGDDYRPEFPWTRTDRAYESVGGERIFSLGKKMHTDSNGTFELLDDDAATAEQRLTTLHYLYRLQGGEIDGEPHIACWRSGRGGVNGIIYGMLSNTLDITYDGDGWYELAIGIRAAKYTLGVTG